MLSGVKNLPAKIGDAGWIPGFGKIPLEEEMATHSGIRALEDPMGQRSLVGLQSMGSQRLGHDSETRQHTSGCVLSS